MECEEALVNLQLTNRTVVRMCEDGSQLADLIITFTKALAETPYKYACVGGGVLCVAGVFGVVVCVWLMCVWVVYGWLVCGWLVCGWVAGVWVGGWCVGGWCIC